MAGDLDAIAAELYVLPPDRFTAERNARARGGDAAAIRALRKPTVSAWAVNLLVQRGELAEAVQLSAAMREAQDDLDAAELSRLGRQRRALVAALAGHAAELADEAGAGISPAAREQIERTINAAVTDAAAAAAVLSGRLVKPLDGGDLDASVLAASVGGSVPGIVAPVRRDDLAERRVRKAAERAAREADQRAAAAARDLARAEARRERSRERVDHLRERVDELHAELERFEADARKAEAELDERTVEAEAASRAAADASQAAQKARRALD
ncbi:transposase [Microbacterium koreense]|uniref:Transposase n=1 Tax=Microbacterium koreense TaxID=323761 RepID=A0ABW2ZMI0_9MICO